MICITNDPLDPDSITARVRSVHNGAIVTFLGTIREDAGDRKVLYLEYEAYRPMADNKLRDVVKELQSRWNFSNNLEECLLDLDRIANKNQYNISDFDPRGN